MNLKRRVCRTGLVGGFVIAFLGSSAGAQESLDRGKTPAQLFASHCSACHKSPRGLAKSGGLFGLDSFLREHYMTSRETAAAMSSYLRGLDSGPAPARASKRAARGDDNAKPNERKKPASKPGEARGPGESKASESMPADILAPEPGSAARKPRVPAAGEAKPKAPGSDKSN
jgi:hypothetical protein